MLKQASFLFFILLICATLPAVAGDTHRAIARSLTNDDIVKMHDADLGETSIIAAIRGSIPQFDTSPDALIALKERGISDAVITALLESTKSPDLTPKAEEKATKKGQWRPV